MDDCYSPKPGIMGAPGPVDIGYGPGGRFIEEAEPLKNNFISLESSQPDLNIFFIGSGGIGKKSGHTGLKFK